MRQRNGCFVLLAGLSVLGVIAFGLASLSKTSNELVLSSLSSEPGGSLALYQLLKAEGIAVERAMTEPKDITDFGLSISFDWNYDVSVAVDGKGSIPESIPVQIQMAIQSDLQPKKQMRTTIIESEFQALPKRAELASPEYLFISTDRRVEPLFYKEKTRIEVITGRPRVNNYIVYIPSGQAFLNRYIAESDNAKIIIALVKTFLPEGKKVLIPEYLYTKGAEETLFTRLGPAFTSFVIQLFLILLFTIYTLGRRFGYPLFDIPRKPSASEFVVALGEAFRRGKSTDIVMQTEYRRAMRMISRKLNLPADVTDAEVYRRLPVQLGQSMMEVRDNQENKISPKEMSRILNELHTQLKEYLH